MPIPFQSWGRRSLSPDPLQTDGASYNKTQSVVQTFSRNHFGGGGTYVYGNAFMSRNNGASFRETYRGDTVDITVGETPVAVFSIDTPNGDTFHYQARMRFARGFFVFDGFLESGGITLWGLDGNDPEGSFVPVQQLYSWPTITPDPLLSGGQAVIAAVPTITPPILLEGSGPNGEDAFWMAVSFAITAGGDNNRQTIKAADLWRSLDGISWEKVRDLSAVSPFSSTTPIYPFTEFFLSTTGRLFLSTAYTDDSDLITADWNLIGGLIPFLGRILPMYGGTLSSYRNGSDISTGFSVVSCDDGENMFNQNNTPTLLGTSFNIKLGPSEVILITKNGSGDMAAFYSTDGGETWAGGNSWGAAFERPVFGALMDDGRPLVVTTASVFTAADLPTGNLTNRIVCPLANAGIAKAKRLDLCGGVITPDCKED